MNHHWQPPRGVHAAASVAERVRDTASVGAMAGVSAARVQQLEHQGIRKLWQLRARELLRRDQARAAIRFVPPERIG